MPGLLIFSRDPAPTNYLIATLERLNIAPERGEAEGLMELRRAVCGRLSAMVIAVRAEATPLWSAAGYSTQLWNGFDEASAVELIRKSGADVVLTGTSDIDEPGNHLLWRGVKVLGAESHVVLDHPAGLDRRFRSTIDERVLPDWIYVPDDIFRDRAVEAGLPIDRLRIIGDLHLDRLHRRNAARTGEALSTLRARWGVDPSNVAVLFVSECGSEMKALGRDSGYDEVALLRNLLRQLQAGRLPSGERVTATAVSVVIRPHPRDAAGKYDAVLATHQGDLRVIVSSEGDSDTAVSAADFVVGIDSSLLYEAYALGRPVHSMIGKDLSRKKSAI
jgi:hypothetical protein